MPKQKWEISSFTKGIVGSAGEGDIPVDAAAFSLNIDCNTEDGTLRSIKTDSVLSNKAGFAATSHESQTVTILKTQEPDENKTVATIAEHTDTDTVQINCDADHGLVDGNTIKFTGSAGTDTDLYDGTYGIESIDANSFRIPAFFVAGAVTDGTYQVIESNTTLHYKSIQIFFSTVSNNYFLYFDTPEPSVPDADTTTGVAVSLGTTHTKTHIAETIKNAINALSDVYASFVAAEEIFTVTCAENAETPIDGACDLFISSDYVTVATLTTGHGTPFRADEMVMNYEGKGVYTLFGLDFSENNLLQWEDIYDKDSRENLKIIKSNIIHNNIATMQSRNKAVHIGLGYGSEFTTQWAGYIDREQLHSNHTGWFVDNDRLEPLSKDLAPLNFDILCATPIFDNSTAFDQKQSYHAEVSRLDVSGGGGTLLADQLHDSGGKLFAIGDGDANDINQYGKANDTLPKIGWTFKITDAYDTSDAKLKAAKRKSFYKTNDSGANPTAGDIFMVVDQGQADNDPSPILEYIGNTELGTESTGDSLTGEAAFFMAAQEGSTLLYKVSTSISTDTAAGLTNGERHEAVDISEIIDDASGISAIQQCRSPLVSGNTTANNLYLNSGDGDIAKDHISYQYCRALHGMYWVACYSGKLYRINTMDFHSQHSNTAIYQGVKLDGLMQLDYSNIGKSDTDESNTGKFKHWYGGIVEANGFFHPYGGGANIDSSSVLNERSDIDNYNSTWQAKPRESRISSIQETWMNNSAATAAEHNVASRYAYDDDSDRDGTGDNIYPATGYMSHHHAQQPSSDTIWEIGSDKTMKITSTGTGTDVGQILTGYKTSDGTGHDDYIGNTIVNRVRGTNQFDVVGTHAASGGNNFPFYSCKVWVLFSKNDVNIPYQKWEMMLFNFYPVTGNLDNKVLMYDRTPPYDEVDVMTSAIDGYSYPGGEFTEFRSLPVQKSSMIFGVNGGSFGSQSHSFGSDQKNTNQPSEFGIIRRDGSCVHFTSYSWRGNEFNDMTGPSHHQFGFYIGFDGRSGGTQHTREMHAIPNTLTAPTTANNHYVRFLGKIKGKWCINGMSHADRRTQGSDRINLGWGSFHEIDDEMSLFYITDTGSKRDDARCYAGWYEEHDGDANNGLNQTEDFHYSDGGRFKNRRRMGSSYENLDVATLDAYSTYDGTSLTDDTVPYVNSAVGTIYHGQIGDFIYIDRKWLSSEAFTGITHKRELGNTNSTSGGSEWSAYRYMEWHNSGSYADIAKTKNGSNARFYNSNGYQRIQTRGVGRIFSNSSNCRTWYGDHYQSSNSSGMPIYECIPQDDMLTNHGASCRQNQMMTALPKGDTGLQASTAGTGYNVAPSSAKQSQLYDLNRYPPSWEIVHPDAATFDILSGDDSEYDLIRKMQQIDSGLLTSSTKGTEDPQSTISVVSTSGQEHFPNNLGGEISGFVNGGNHTYNPYYYRATNGSTSTMTRSLNINYKREFITSPKITVVPLITHYAQNAPTDAWGKFWCVGYMPAVNTDLSEVTNSQIQFIAPLDTNQLDLLPAPGEFDDLADIANYTKNNSFVSLVSGVSGLMTEFPSGANIRYKVSLLYDDHQESPLSVYFYDFDQISNMETMSPTIRLDSSGTSTFSPRVSHLVIYRRNNTSDPYRMVKEISLKPKDWELQSTGIYTNTFTDKARLGSYEALTGISEGTTETSLNYELSCQLNQYLFIAKAYHSELKEDGEKNIFRSKPGKYSIFDPKKDVISLPTIPTAITAFNGKLYAFDRSNTYRIDPNSLVVEDVFNGIGCLGPSAIAVTEYGMCFADANNIYLHDSTKPTPIAANILTLAAYQGFDIGWQKAVEKSEKIYNTNPLVFFDGKSNSFVCLVLGSCEQNCNPFVSRAWVYNIMKNRWDYWEAPKTITAVHGDDGNILLTDGNFLYNYKNGASYREWKWMSKKITGGKETTKKVFHRIRFTGDVSMNTLSNPPKWNDDVVVYLDGEIQQLTLMNTKYIQSFSSCFFKTGGDMTTSSTTLTIVGLNGGDIGGELPSIDSFIMLDDEIMLVTAHPSAISLTVTRAQMGTTAAIHTPTGAGAEGLENQRLYNISPCIKLPSKCKGNNLQVYLQNQKGTVGTMAVDLIIKENSGS